MRNAILGLAVILCGAAVAEEARSVETAEQAVRLSAEEAAKGRPCRFQGVVIHASAIRPHTWVVAQQEAVYRGGVVVEATADAELSGEPFGEGDVVFVAGRTAAERGGAVVRADRVERRKTIAIKTDFPRKFHDFRKGLLHGRTMRLKGVVRDVAAEGEASILTLKADGRLFTVRAPGRLSAKRCVGRPVRVLGCAFNERTADGDLMEAVLEVAEPDDIVFLDDTPPPAWLLPAALALLAAALVAILALVVRQRRESHAARAVAADRRRMAAELHDTIEQHLATAKILLSGALGVKGLPDEARDTVRTAANVLANAKVEVRDAVMDLRGDGVRDVRDALRLLAAQVSAPGAVKVRTALAALPRDIGGARGRDLVAIAREAVTNAVKHGKARNVAIVCDKGGAASAAHTFVLRILNDGEEFDGETPLGPEAGHFGISGMRERARRSGFAFAFVKTGRWCGVEVKA